MPCPCSAGFGTAAAWLGEGGHVSERYTKLLEERDFRLDWAERIGPGFDLPAPVGKHGKLHRGRGLSLQITRLLLSRFRSILIDCLRRLTTTA
jgi:hypothetical protein